MQSRIAPHSDTDSRIYIPDIEEAINYYRQLRTSAGVFDSNESLLNTKLFSLAEVYGIMAHFKLDSVYFDALSADAQNAWLEWYETTPDTPCIAICSTAQGDNVCKGCGRTEHEVIEWPSMSPTAKRRVWRRIITEGDSWRFNRYAERTQSQSLTAFDNIELTKKSTTVTSPLTNNHCRLLNWTPKRTIYECSSRSTNTFCLTF